MRLTDHLTIAFRINHFYESYVWKHIWINGIVKTLCFAVIIIAFSSTSRKSWICSFKLIKEQIQDFLDLHCGWKSYYYNSSNFFEYGICKLNLSYSPVFRLSMRILKMCLTFQVGTFALLLFISIFIYGLQAKMLH